MKWVFSGLLFILTAVRLNYTLHLPRGDPLNGGRDFYGAFLPPPSQLASPFMLGGGTLQIPSSRSCSSYRS